MGPVIRIGDQGNPAAGKGDPFRVRNRNPGTVRKHQLERPERRGVNRLLQSDRVHFALSSSAVMVFMTAIRAYEAFVSTNLRA